MKKNCSSLKGWKRNLGWRSSFVLLQILTRSPIILTRSRSDGGTFSVHYKSSTEVGATDIKKANEFYANVI